MKYAVLILLLLLSSCADREKSISENREIYESKRQIQNEITLGEASTDILDSESNRVANINLACQSINKERLRPGSEFSFNNLTGERSAENGYRSASVISNGEVSQGIGGGVCQVSSTIYIAAVNSNMEITERHMHSVPVAYAPDRNDATVVYGSLDLKFVNNTDSTICIYTWVQNGKVHCKIVAE